jgi:hypothetical protein
LGESDSDLDQNEVRKRCAQLMPDCDSEIRSTISHMHRCFNIDAGFAPWFAVTHEWVPA